MIILHHILCLNQSFRYILIIADVEFYHSILLYFHKVKMERILVIIKLYSMLNKNGGNIIFLLSI